MRLTDLVLSAVDEAVVPAFTRALAVAPQQWWYPTAFRASRALAPFARLRTEPAHDAHRHDARLLNRFLSLLTRTGCAFDVPWRASGGALLAAPGPLVLCSAHIPLIKVGLCAAMELGYPPTVALAERPGADRAIAIWGLRERLPAIPTDVCSLVRVRSILRAGGSVTLLLDSMKGAPFSPNIFQLAGRVGARVVFFFTELEPDGTIAVTFALPPDPWCGSEAGIATNLTALADETRRILEQGRPARGERHRK